MWNRITATITNLTPYERSSTRNRAIIAYYTVYAFLLFFTLYGVFAPFQVTIAGLGLDERLTYFYRALRPGEYPVFTLAFISFYILGAYTLWQLWRGNLARVTLAPSVMIYLGTVSIGVLNNIGNAQNAYLLLPAILIAGLLDGERGILIFTPPHFITIIVGYAIFIPIDPSNGIPGLFLLVILSSVFIGLVYAYLRIARTASSETEDELIAQRLQIAQLTTRITRSIAEPENLSDILNTLVHEIRQTFPRAYHVQIFLIDETGREAKLIASTGAPGRQLLALNHSLPVGSSSVIGFVTQQQRPYRAVVGVESEFHRPNPYLPDTRLEVALPLNVGNRTIGALDLQSTNPEAFQPADLTTLQAIADSIAITINNSRLLAQTNERLKENQLLVERMTATQREVERLNRELTGTIWTDYLSSGDRSYNMDIDLESEQVITSEDFSAAILDAIQRDDLIRQEADGKSYIAVPLRVRGEVIGAMEFEIERDLSGVDLEMLQEIGERFGLAAENTRLYQDSQRTAQREALVNEISTRIQSANSVDATLTEAARSLRDALKAKRVAIQLGTPSRSNGKEQSA